VSESSSNPSAPDGSQAPQVALPPPPTDAAMAAIEALLVPARAWFRPQIDGWNVVPNDRPLLFVGNHTLYGIVDIPHLMVALWRRRGIKLRSLGDHAHFKVPVWRRVMREAGVVDGTRDNCAEAFRQRQCVLVFPGGARESFKGRDERYSLIWGERLGFARMAIRHGVTIVPFAAIGADDAFRLAMDRDELKESRLGSMLSRLGVKDDYLVPLPSHLVPTPRKLYFRFLPPIPTRDMGELDEDVAAQQLRDRTRTAVAGGIEALRRLRRSDPWDGFGPVEDWLAGL